MSHMSQRRIAAGQSIRNVGHHRAGLMSHMSHPGGPPMSLMSHMGHSAVPSSAQFSGPMGHVGHDPRPFPTWPSTSPAASRPEEAGDAYGLAPGPRRRPCWRLSPALAGVGGW